MASPTENIVAALLDLAIDNGKLYANTKEMIYKQREVYLRRLAVSFTQFSAQAVTGVPDLQEVTDEGSVTTNSIEANAFIKTGGTSSQFLKADGSVDSNTYLTATSIKYGSFYDNTIQTIAAPFEEKTVAINTTAYSNDVTLAMNRLYFATVGMYNIQVSLQVTNTYNQAQLFYLWFAYNGVAIADSASIATIPSTHGGNNGHYIFAMNLFVDVLAPGDNIELKWTADLASIQLEAITPGIGTIPASPSVIVTATLV
jgi:hypothetical protein